MFMHSHNLLLLGGHSLSSCGGVEAPESHACTHKDQYHRGAANEKMRRVTAFPELLVYTNTASLVHQAARTPSSPQNHFIPHTTQWALFLWWPSWSGVSFPAPVRPVDADGPAAVLTQVKVVVLSVTEEHEATDGVNEGCLVRV